MEQFRELPPVSRAISGVMIGGYLIQLVIPSSKFIFCLISGKAIPRVWTILTSGLLQDNIFSVSLHPASAFIAGALSTYPSLPPPSLHLQLTVFVLINTLLSRTLEPVQGHAEFLRFMLVSLAGSGVLTFFLITFLYYVMVVAGAGGPVADHAADILYTPICGFQGGVAALLVAVKQAIPDNQITLFSSFQLRAGDVAGIYLIAVTLLGLVTGTALQLVPFSLFGAYSAWFYLRFFHYKQDSFLRGDPADHFRFASFFPGKAQLYADKVAAACSNVTKLRADSSQEAPSQHSSTVLLGRGSPDKDTAEAARRR